MEGACILAETNQLEELAKDVNDVNASQNNPQACGQWFFMLFSPHRAGRIYQALPSEVSLAPFGKFPPAGCTRIGSFRSLAPENEGPNPITPIKSPEIRTNPHLSRLRPLLG